MAGSTRRIAVLGGLVVAVGAGAALAASAGSSDDARAIPVPTTLHAGERTDDDDTIHDPVDTLAVDGRFTTWHAVVQWSGLDAELRAMPALTLLAPTDDAFEDMDDGERRDLLEDEERMARMVRYLALTEVVATSDIRVFNGGPLPSLADGGTGPTLSVGEGDTGALRLDDTADIIVERRQITPELEIPLPGLETSNGYVQPLDAVIEPPGA